jgi:protein AroM
VSVVGLVTIGQAPRVDVTLDILPMLGVVDIVEHGALDDLDPDQIAALRPEPGESLVVSRLRTGDSAVMSEERVIPHVQRAVDRAVADGAAAILVLCTGHLRGLSSRVPLYTAEQLGRGGAHAIVGDRRMGVIAPEPEQCEPIAERWRREFAREVTVVAADPYTATTEEIVRVGKCLVDSGAEWIFLDCIGYSEAMADAVAAETGAHVVTARSMAARLVAGALR